jgi:hypothetical protein
MIVPTKAIISAYSHCVQTAQTGRSRLPPGEVFRYTNVMFMPVNGKNVIYECAQRGDVCPVVESGKIYSVEQDGSSIYIEMSLPNGKHFSAKYKQLGSW